jgi:hypothetical protein
MLKVNWEKGVHFIFLCQNKCARVSVIVFLIFSQPIREAINHIHS